MTIRVLQRILRTAAALAALMGLPSTGHAQPAAQWVGAFAASASATMGSATFQGFTVRQTVHPSAGGNQYRIRLSNELSAQPITIGAVQAAASGSTPGAINPAYSLPVLFGGLGSVTIPANASVVSDPVSGTVAAGTDFTISLYVSAATVGPTIHGSGQATVFFAPGNQVTAVSLAGALSFNSRVVLSGVDVLQPAGGATIVAIGDSITDGINSTIDANHRWPDYLAQRIQSSSLAVKPGVVDAGIGGNQLLLDSSWAGPSVLSRLPRDVLAVPGLRYICVLIGINDINVAATIGPPLTAGQIVQGYQEIIQKAHEQNVKVFISTITPVGGSIVLTPTNEAIRTAVNAWVRAGQGFDGVLDFDAALRDPAIPTQMRAVFDSGDHVHPNDVGYNAMANSISLSLFQP